VAGRARSQIEYPYLDQFAEFVEFRTPRDPLQFTHIDPALVKIMTDGLPASIDAPVSLLTPDEQVRAGAARIRENLAAQLLERVKRGSPSAFEQLVVDLLVAMGYGGSHEDAAQVVGKSGDGGIDGIIKEDRFRAGEHLRSSEALGRCDGRPPSRSTRVERL
jgi:restriction system protein